MARAKIDEMVEKKHLRPINNSPLGIPIIMVPKPGTKKMRMVVDMRLYNALTEKVNLTFFHHRFLSKYFQQRVLISLSDF